VVGILVAYGRRNVLDFQAGLPQQRFRTGQAQTFLQLTQRLACFAPDHAAEVGRIVVEPRGERQEDPSVW
jgi:hypothetical protein